MALVPDISTTADSIVSLTASRNSRTTNRIALERKDRQLPGAVTKGFDGNAELVQHREEEIGVRRIGLDLKMTPTVKRAPTTAHQ